MDTRTSTIRLRIDRLREELERLGVHALLVPSADPHLSEYLPERWQSRQENDNNNNSREIFRSAS